jgi:hypothetical protein
LGCNARKTNKQTNNDFIETVIGMRTKVGFKIIPNIPECLGERGIQTDKHGQIDMDVRRALQNMKN